MNWRRWVVTITLLVTAGLIVVYGIGERVPVEHTAVAAQTIAAPPAKVWALISNVDAQPKWRSGMTSVQDLPPELGKQRWAEHYKGLVMNFVLEENQPMSERVVWLEPAGDAYDGSWTYQLLPMDNGSTSVTITEHGNVYSPLYRFIMHYILGDTYDQKRYLNDLNRAATS